MLQLVISILTQWHERNAQRLMDILVADHQHLTANGSVTIGRFLPSRWRAATTYEQEDDVECEIPAFRSVQ